MTSGGVEYEPELGQLVFGQPSQRYQAPDDLEYALDAIRGCLDAALRYRGHDIGSFDSPFSNSGAAFRCPVFGVWSYQWGDKEEQPCNFYHWPSKLKVSWYKWCGRGLSVDRRVDEHFCDKVLLSCVEAIVQIRRGKMEYQYGGLGQIAYP